MAEKKPWEYVIPSPNDTALQSDVNFQSSLNEKLSNVDKPIRTGAGNQTIQVDKNKGIWAGNAEFTDAPFRVDTDGNVTATSATLSGNITSSSGTIGGFTIGATELTATNLNITSGAANTAKVSVGTGSNLAGLNSANASTDVAIWAGATHANRATAPFRVLADGSVVATKIRTLSRFLSFTGSATDGLSEILSSGTITRGIFDTTLNASGGAGRVAALQSASTVASTDWDDACDFSCQVYWQSPANGINAFLGLGLNIEISVPNCPDNATSTSRHIGFFLDDTTLYASNADNTTQTKTDVSSGVTLAAWNSYSFIYTGSKVEFYINGALVATHTTNLPVGPNYGLLGFIVESTSASLTGMFLNNQYNVTFTI